MRLQSCEGLTGAGQFASVRPHSRSWWLKASISCWLLDLSVGPLSVIMTWQLASPRNNPRKGARKWSKRKKEVETEMPFISILGVPLHPLQHVLFVGSELSSATLSEWGGGLAPPLKGGASKNLWTFSFLNHHITIFGIIKFYFIAHFTLFSLHEYLYYLFIFAITCSVIIKIFICTCFPHVHIC